MVDCKTCENSYCERAKKDGKFPAACSGYKAPKNQQTNADRIRAMSDEELAEWLVSKTAYQESAFSPTSYLNFLTGLDDTKESAFRGTVDWLRQPVGVGE